MKFVSWVQNDQSDLELENIIQSVMSLKNIFSLCEINEFGKLGNSYWEF